VSESEAASQVSGPMYDLSLQGNGVTVEREIPESIARMIVTLVMGGAAMSPIVGRMASSAGGTTGIEAPGAPESRQSVREFLNQVGPKRNADTITAIAAYLKNSGQESFTRDQVKDYFRKAGEPSPSNYNRDFADALSTGWIAEDHTNVGSYYITASGEDALRSGFPGKIRRYKKRKARKANAGDEA
jgi:hypothetical protein